MQKRHDRRVVPLTSIKLDLGNPNKMTDKQMVALGESFEKFGYVQEIVVDKNTMMVADGEHRLLKLMNDGVSEAEVILFDFKDETERRLFRQMANKLHGEHDKKLDQEEYQFLLEHNAFPELKSLLAMSETDEVRFLSKARPEDEGEFMPEVKPPKYLVKQGDRFKLGSHIIMCGDATSAIDAHILMGEDLADIVFTDPPYGVSYTGINNPNGRDWGEMQNDDLRGEDLQDFLTKAFRNAFTRTTETPAVYCCYASINHQQFEWALNDSGFKVKQVLIWDKGHILGHSDYHWCHEPIMYAIKEDHNCPWYGDRAEKTMLNCKDEDLEEMTPAQLRAVLQKIRTTSDIIRIRKDAAQDYIHPTQKPVELPKRMLINSSKPGDIVLDLFAGSGSTLMAAEETKRRARCMELSPVYVSAIIERWEAKTGLKHERMP
jgi:DNA modification methylase